MRRRHLPQRGLLALLLLVPLLFAAPGPVVADAPAPTASAAQAPAPPKVEAERALAKLGKRLDEMGATYGVAFVDLDSGALLAAKNEHAPLNPASNTKLWTAWTALVRLGAAHRFTTQLFGKNEGGKVAKLVVRGSGDPTLEDADLVALAQELRSAGVREVAELAVDGSFFDDQTVPPAFEQQPDEWNPFRAPVAAFSVDENSIRIRVEPAAKGKKATVRVEPEGAVTVAGEVKTGAKGKAAKVAADMKASGSKLLLTMGGTIPEGGKAVTVYRRVEDPTYFGLLILRRALRDVGIQVGDKLSVGTKGNLKVLASRRSRPLGEILSLLGKDSDNFAAEMVMKTLGATKEAPASFALGARAVETEVGALGAWDAGSRVRNGSGLFDAGRGTAFGFATLVRKASRSPSHGAEFLAHLSIGGVDGTLRGRYPKLPAPRIVRAKTGTLGNAVALSGVVVAPEGRSGVAFSILVSGVKDKVAETRAAADAAVVSIAEALWKTP